MSTVECLRLEAYMPPVCDSCSIRAVTYAMMPSCMCMPAHAPGKERGDGLCRARGSGDRPLRQRGRVTYRTLQRQFQLDAEALADLLGELRYAHQEALREDEQGLIWTDEARPTPPAPPGPRRRGPGPTTYTPAYLAEQILTSRSALEGERKQVTVLFADIKDSTELIRDLDPEAAQQLLDPALHAMMAAVHRYEGTVNQVLGDGIMALFGAPWPMRTTLCAPATPP